MYGLQGAGEDGGMNWEIRIDMWLTFSAVQQSPGSHTKFCEETGGHV